jgi:hypothetical protein
MLDMIKRAVAAVRRFTSEREPVAVVSSTAATAVALVAEWQGDLQGEHAWVAVAWGLGTLIARQLATPAATAETQTITLHLDAGAVADALTEEVRRQLGKQPTPPVV